MFNKTVVIMLCVVVSWGYCTSYAQDNSSMQTKIVVNVNNGTHNGDSVTGDTVIVNIYKNENVVDTLTGIVNDENVAIFENISPDDDIRVVAACEHQGVRFQGVVIALEDSQLTHNVSVDVYDVSTDKSKLTASTHHVIIKRKETQLVVHEYLYLENNSDTAVGSTVSQDGERAAVVQLFLPRGYSQFHAISYFVPELLNFTPDSVEDPMAVAPGQYDMHLSYVLDIKSKELKFEKKLSLVTSDLIVFTALPGVQVKGLGEPVDFAMADGMVGQYYPIGSQNPGDLVTFELIGLPVIKTDYSWVVLAFVFAFVLIVVLLRLKKSKPVNS